MAWTSQPESIEVRNAWDGLTRSIWTVIPRHRDRLNQLASRSIWG